MQAVLQPQTKLTDPTAPRELPPVNSCSVTSHKTYSYKTHAKFRGVVSHTKMKSEHTESYAEAQAFLQSDMKSRVMTKTCPRYTDVVLGDKPFTGSILVK